jgi:hypothetical protein
MNNLTAVPGILLREIMETVDNRKSSQVPNWRHCQVVRNSRKIFTWEVPVSGLKLSFISISPLPGKCSKVVFNMSSYALPSSSLIAFLSHVSINVSPKQRNCL